MTAPAMPRTVLVELREAERRVLDHLETAGGQEWAAAPSGLPGWTRAHVVAHLAGNAEGLLNLVTWVETGVETPMYPTRDARAAEIDRRAQLSWAVLVEELGTLSRQLLSRLESAQEPLKARSTRLGSGSEVEAWELPAVRLREVEVHHVDINDGYRPDDWSERFTFRTLSQLSPFFEAHRQVSVATLRATDTGRAWPVGTGPDLLGNEAQLLAWLLGRSHSGLHSSNGSAVPESPTWV